MATACRRFAKRPREQHEVVVRRGYGQVHDPSPTDRNHGAFRGGADHPHVCRPLGWCIILLHLFARLHAVRD